MEIRSPAFRFVANLYTDGKISGYVYRQGETKEVGGKLIATVDGEEYTLTPVDVDNKRYSISYKGETYEGDYDYLCWKVKVTRNSIAISALSKMAILTFILRLSLA